MKRIKDNSRGTTLVSVMISFVILLMIIAMFSQAVSSSLTFSKKADETAKDTTEAVNAYYTGSEQETGNTKVYFKLDEEELEEEVDIAHNESSSQGRTIYYFK